MTEWTNECDLVVVMYVHIWCRHNNDKLIMLMISFLWFLYFALYLVHCIPYTRCVTFFVYVICELGLRTHKCDGTQLMSFSSTPHIPINAYTKRFSKKKKAIYMAIILWNETVWIRWKREWEKEIGRMKVRRRTRIYSWDIFDANWKPDVKISYFDWFNHASVSIFIPLSN